LIFLRERGRTLRQRVGRKYWGLTIRSSLNAADRIIAVSGKTARELVSLGLAPAESVDVIHHGVSCAAGRTQRKGRYVVAFGGADPRKGVGLVLRAYADAVREGCELRLVLLAGAGLAHADEELAARLPGVDLIPYVSDSEMHSTLAGAIALIHASRDEGFGLPVLEAMAAGTAVISGLCETTSEIAGDNFIRIDAQDPRRSLTEHLRALSADRHLADSYAARGIAQAREFSWQRSASEHVRVYRLAVNRRLPKHPDPIRARRGPE
jgi:glycosyltransferase involved in cell wall biosynthesis